VIRADNSLGGFSGGVRWKKTLIALELGQKNIDFEDLRA
jgi:O6-methylguanine-DNA--protein-cysteine methyltransferase